MAGLLITLLVIGVVLALLGLFVKAIFFLFWIAIILIIVSIIGYIFRYIQSRA
jgi:hypothetical protein